MSFIDDMTAWSKKISSGVNNTSTASGGFDLSNWIKLPTVKTDVDLGATTIAVLAGALTFIGFLVLRKRR